LQYVATKLSKSREMSKHIIEIFFTDSDTNLPETGVIPLWKDGAAFGIQTHCSNILFHHMKQIADRSGKKAFPSQATRFFCPPEVTSSSYEEVHPFYSLVLPSSSAFN